MTDTPTRVREMVVENLALSILPADDRTLASLGADSLDALELAMDLEEEFRIDVPDDEIEGCRTVGDVIAMVERLVAARSDMVPL